MNKHFKAAEQRITNVIEQLKIYLEDGADPIDCYNPEALDEAIHNLIQARCAMAVGRSKKP